MGCGRRPATGLDWVFSNVDRAIILEDDCVPHPAFFRYCDELLDRYANCPEVMQICGSHPMIPTENMKTSYFFSRNVICWGWATWARAWHLYDYQLTDWNRRRDRAMLKQVLRFPNAINNWSLRLDAAKNDSESIDYWDYQWQYTIWKYGGVSIFPTANLISNIGFGELATHTRNASSEFSQRQYDDLSFPLQHPATTHFSEEMDALYCRERYGKKRKRKRYRSIISRVVRRVLAR
jgi:hypothetical protein